MTRKQKKVLYRIIASSLLMIALHFAPATGLAKFALYLIPYLIIGYDILIDAVRGVINRQLFDENFLMAVATVGAMALGVFKTGDYLEGIAVMLFYQIGELFQSCAIGKSRRSISELMDIRPDYANIEQNGALIKVDPDEIEPDTVIIVQPGEKVPIDGVIVEGISTLDTAALTGESRPRDVAIGDEIMSGCINMTGVLKIKTTKPFGESTVSKILDMVENASSRKSRSEDFISRFARFYTPAVCYGALALALIPPLVRIFVFGVSADWGEWLYRALTFLVISCPCALVISIPLSFFAGIGGASRAGVLVKGSNYLEALSQAGTVVFDKTGTLTKGDFEVAEINSTALPAEKLLEYAALAEAASSHPISQSLKRAYGKEIDRSRVSEIEDISGNGVTAKVDGIEIAAGNLKLMNRLDISVSEQQTAATVVYIAMNGEYAGNIAIEDTLKANSKQTISKLKTLDISKTVMLTGDSRAVAEKTAENLGIDAVFSELLPNDKVEQVEKLLNKRKKLVFVGDGINDTPVLSRADIGIAMGAMGSDAAIEAADIVLMDDDPLKVAKAIKISRKCMGIVYQNIVGAIGVKLLCLLLGALGIANMWLAIFADVGIMVLAVMNAVRALYVKDI
ncbi:MAG: cadmium-translocating P-type ATPase [Oscillospiraceae bacterium]|nr:cadmium-translocating P-type ATPase [Oscillospiraceae bacterium]